MSYEACKKAFKDNEEETIKELQQLRYFWWRISCYSFDENKPDGIGIGHDGWKGWIETRNFYRDLYERTHSIPEWVGR